MKPVYQYYSACFDARMAPCVIDVGKVLLIRRPSAPPLMLVVEMVTETDIPHMFCLVGRTRDPVAMVPEEEELT